MTEGWSRRRALAALGASATVGIAGCAGAPVSPGGTGTPADGTPEDDADETVSLPAGDGVGMSCYTGQQEYFFSPRLLRVEPGTTVSFGVTSTCRQRTLAYHPANDAPLRIPREAEPWASPVLQGKLGGSFEYAFEHEGVYDYFGLHEGSGQVGSVVVGSPDPDGDEPGLAPPQPSIPAPAREAIRALNERTRAALEGQ